MALDQALDQLLNTPQNIRLNYKPFTVYKRINKDMANKMHYIEEQYELQQKIEESECSFHPKISEAAYKVEQAPLWERQSHVRDESKVLFTESNVESGPKTGAKPRPFNPQHSIYHYLKNKKAKNDAGKSAQKTIQYLKVSQEQYYRYDDFYNRYLKFLQDHANKACQEPVEAAKVAQKPVCEEETFNRFLQRNYNAEKRRYLNIRMLENQIYKNMSFRPYISKKSQYLARNSGYTMKPADVYERERLERLERLRQREFEQQCTFQPHINYNSRYLADRYYKPSVFDYQYQVKDRDCRHERLRERVRAEEMRNLTLRPQIIQAPNYLYGEAVEHTTFEYKLKQQLERQEYRIYYYCALRKQNEAKEMQECTFYPKTYRNNARFDYSTVVEQIRRQNVQE